jgi:hypothetical protein
MKNLLLLLILLCSCTEIETSEKFVGNWSISWSIDTEIREGTLVLNSDYSGYISTNTDPNSSLLSVEAYVPIKWKHKDAQLVLTRMDNDFSLNYKILEIGNNLVALRFADDIDVTLHRK